MSKFNSFKDFGASMGVDVKKSDPEVRVCHSCQGKMYLIPGTNIYRCQSCKKTVISGK